MTPLTTPTPRWLAATPIAIARTRSHTGRCAYFDQGRCTSWRAVMAATSSAILLTSTTVPSTNHPWTINCLLVFIGFEGIDGASHHRGTGPGF
jgi:hypothetical protein